MHVISLTLPGYGLTQVTSAALTATIDKYLPSSAYDLRAIINDRIGYEMFDRPMDISEALIVLADFDHNHDGSLLSLDARFAKG